MKKRTLSFQLTSQTLDPSQSSWRLDRSITQWLAHHHWVYAREDSSLACSPQTGTQEEQSKRRESVSKQISTKQVKSLIESCGVQVNQTQTYRSSLRVQDGDWIDFVSPPSWMQKLDMTVSAPPLPHSLSSSTPSFSLSPVEKASQTLKSPPLDVCYQDQWHLVVNKPSGIPTSPTRDPKRPSLFHYVLKSQWHPLSDPPPYLRVLHRLDLPTSGLVMMSKDPQVNSFFDHAFKKHHIQKRYLALTSSKPTLFPHNHKAHWTLNTADDWSSFIHKQLHSDCFEVASTSQKVNRWFDLKTTLRKDPQSPKKQTRWQVGERLTSSKVKNYAYSSFSLLAVYQPAQGRPLWLSEVRLHTGRTHQIRAHLAYLEAPLVGDWLYGGLHPWSFFGLHARSIRYPHPQSSSPLVHLAHLPNSWHMI